MTTPAKYPDYTRTFAEVYLAELDYVKKRRDKMGLPSETVATESERVRQELNQQTANGGSENHQEEPNSNVSVSADANLVGLSLSGGGIRSATFNLGLLQKLDKKGILRNCDYLSTVSGGGYIGSCLSSLLTNREASTDSSAEKKQFPFRFNRDSESDEHQEVDYQLQSTPDIYKERREINYLRGTKNYLQLKDSLFSLETWRFLATFFSGQVLINLIPLAIMILVAYGLFVIESPVAQYSCIPKGSITIKNCVPVDNVEICSDEKLVEKGGKYIKLELKTEEVDMLPFSKVDGKNPTDHYCYMDNSHCNDSSKFCAYYDKCQEKGHIRKFNHQATHQKFMSYMTNLFMVAMLAFSLMVFMRLLATSLNSSGLITKLQTLFAITTVSIITIAGLIAATYYLFLDKNGTVGEQLFAWMNYTLLAAVLFFILGRLETKNRTLQKVLKMMLYTALVVVIPIVFAQVMHLMWEYDFFRKPLSHFWPEFEFLDYLDFMPIPILVALILLAISFMVNINRISLHAFYRDGLSNTYIIKREGKKIVPNRDLKLKDIHEHYNGPYHLINVALNLQSSRNRHLSGRGADYFIFSKLYCGAESTGYRSTKVYKNGETELATAMAISGAAASPARGEQTNPIMAFYMTLLNIRLNVWMPNPDPKYALPIPTIWPWYFMKEFLRFNRETNSLVNLSDGGHHENLGAYALLKRRCRLIIISDAGCDPEYKMDDLANLKRKARIDLGINIDLDMTPLHPKGRDGNTKDYYAKGIINYPNDTDGVLFYIKTTMTGKEPEDLLGYRRNSPKFPDETTANQFFKEDQFESYRKLGEVAGSEMCAEINEEITKLFG